MVLQKLQCHYDTYVPMAVKGLVGIVNVLDLSARPDLDIILQFCPVVEYGYQDR